MATGVRMSNRLLGDFETSLLLAVISLRDEAYGPKIAAAIEQRTGRKPAPGAIYTALARIEQKGYVTSRESQPAAMRGGRRRRYYKVEETGIEAVRAKAAMLSDLNETLKRCH
ncbi:MAG TPA: helix-turn-helix transcriptional regulator [Bryobacteraceae bacterium]|nr:helix-turn-helix transcriptional regulator [Bryobacteraceae bacterium]